MITSVHVFLNMKTVLLKYLNLNLLLGIFFLLASTLDFVTPNQVTCLQKERFYRNPKRPPHKIWTEDECSKYYLCLENEVFEFKCSPGLLFDVNRQICDFKFNVDNCDISTEVSIPKPLLEEAQCPENQLGCADGTCMPKHYFCDGSTDCTDGSDEAHCQVNDDKFAAPVCKSDCQLPECFCSLDGTRAPGFMPTNQIPQMILLTFDDAVNPDNFQLYTREIFNSNYTNPNGCPIQGTFFVSHQYNNYQQTQKLWNRGHEIAVHSITHRGPEEWWTYNATIEDWFDEMIGQANILNKFGKVRLFDIKGLRVPFLRVGWNRQFLMMKEFGFVYDSSMVAPFSDPPLWPYTLDFKMPHSCTGKNQICPSRSYPGVWEMVINPLIIKNQTCPTVQACYLNLTRDEVYKMLVHNFRRHYLNNRAPFGLHFHSTWFKNSQNLRAFKKFMNELQRLNDVWFVSNWKAIQWMRQPTPLRKLDSFEAWNCNKEFQYDEIACDHPNNCKLFSRIFQQYRYMITCSDCPEKYPWIRNENGTE